MESRFYSARLFTLLLALLVVLTGGLAEAGEVPRPVAAGTEQRGTTFASLAGEAQLEESPSSRRRAVRRTPQELRQIDEIVAAYLAYGIPGISIAVQRGNEIVYEKGYGFANREQEIPVDRTTIFQIASVTKQFTAAAIMRLVERGALELSDSVRDYVPELDTRGRTITIEQLLNHTSGLPDYIRLITDPYKPMTQTEVVALINSGPLNFPPGTSWSYDNSGYYLLGMVIERITGLTYAEYLDREIIQPLGLLHTSYCGTNPAQPMPDGYLMFGGNVTAVRAAHNSLGYSAGSLCSSASDLRRWSEALTSGLVVTPQSYEQMTARTRLADGRTVGYGYGLGLGIRYGERVVEHGGSILGFLSYLGWYPEPDVRIAVLVNVTSLDTPWAAEIARDLAQFLLSK
jgi:D-alanyl-D-alanine carboxypeptidase